MTGYLGYDDGYRDGESNVSADWGFAMHDGPLDLDDECEVTPMRLSSALAELLTPEQKVRLAELLRPQTP